MILRALNLEEELDDLLRRLAFGENKSKSELMRNLIIYALYLKKKVPRHLLNADWVKKALRATTKQVKKKK